VGARCVQVWWTVVAGQGRVVQAGGRHPKCVVQAQCDSSVEWVQCVQGGASRFSVQQCGAAGGSNKALFAELVNQGRHRQKQSRPRCNVVVGGGR